MLTWKKQIRSSAAGAYSGSLTRRRKNGFDVSQPLVMGVLNVTPDSFSDGGQFLSPAKGVKRALQIVKEGADIIDIGGQSTAPGSADVSLEEELKRVIPVVRAIEDIMMKNEGGGKNTPVYSFQTAKPVSQNQRRRNFLISVDTWRAEVARQALKAGADMINDVTALRGDSKMASVLAKTRAPVILMYSKDVVARTSSKKVHYKDVVETIVGFLKKRIDFARHAGIARKNIIIDPGMGAFVSSKAGYSLEILARLKEFQIFGLPILVGPSRKGFIGAVLAKLAGPRLSRPGKTGRVKIIPLPVSERLEGSLACAAVAVMNSASILRVHDVKQTRRIVDMTYAIKNACQS